MNTVLVDTSVWVEHFKRRNNALVALLEAGSAATHPLIIGELACGTPPSREQTLSDMGLLQQTQQASLDEVLVFIEREKIYGRGCGLIDVILLASTLITPGAELWTLDKGLSGLAKSFGVMHKPFLH